MRAIKSVLQASSVLKRDETGLSEEVIILRALCDMNLPKFLTDDI